MILYSSGLFVPRDHPRTQVLKDRATLRNPAYDEHEQMVRARVRSRMAPKPPKTITTWRTIPAPHPWAGGTLFPRCLPLDDCDRAELVDGRSQGDPINAQLSASTTLRDYQTAACDDFTEVETGVVVFPCGGGKTTTGVGLIARLKTRTLILVHTVDLAEQWVDRLREQLTGITVGVVGDGRRESTEDVVVATIQTLSRWDLPELYRWGRGFGLAVLDEAHHAPAESFLGVLMGLPCRYVLGLTATPEREDGMTPLLWQAFGGIAYQATRDQLIDVGAIRPARLTVEKTGWTTRSHVVRYEKTWTPVHAADAKQARADGLPVKPRRYDAQIAELVGDAGRNARIRQLVAGRVVAGHSVIVLSCRVEHCRQLARDLSAEGVPAEPLAGRQTAGEVKRILDRARAGVTKVLVGTTKADEGLDVPRLSCGVLVAPAKKLGRVTQRLGRIERPGDLEPEWIDLVDDFPSAARAWRARRKLYRSLKLVGAE